MSTGIRRTPGRPRVAKLDDSILEATLSLLAEQGYTRMSLDAIAAAAGVSKPTIYRRWPSKAEVAMAALARNIDAEPRPPAAESSRQTLVLMLRKLRKRLIAPNNMALVGTLLAEEKQTPELVALFREQVWKRRSEQLREVLIRARERSEVARGADLEAAIKLLIGSMYAVYLDEQTIPADWPERIVAVVWRGIAAAGEERSAR